MFARLKSTEEFKTVANGLWRDHPIFSMVLGICTALAVSNKVDNAIAMSAGTTFVLVATAIIISLLRKLISTRVRIITFMIVIASFVIIVDKAIEAFFPSISEALGPYIGLIITNCIIMGRAEAFYIQNKVHLSILDALANGLGYTYTLVSIAIIREALGFGTILGIRVMPAGWTNWVIMAMAPGAFFILSVFIWLSRTLAKIEP
ncbi:MAG: NADH:ubiquinone reductase (Na(+)-transporting) subunit D [Spirochaetes bacterium]|nr:NADH:ubiquinone reductase (Na(+)-transporting) subunit D [Spirochaetota bacterium]